MDFRQTLRKKLRTQRESLTLSEQTIASKKITALVTQSPLFFQSQHIAAYIAINYEINLEIIIKKIWKLDKCCYLPTLQDKQLKFSLYKNDTPLKNNQFNIPEPLASHSYTIKPQHLDLVLVPLLGYTLKCERLGMGGGFYDRSFAFLLKNPRPKKPFLLGLAYEWQKLETLETKPWDVPLNAIASENKIIYANLSDQL